MNLTKEPCLYADMLQCRNAGGLVLYETETALLLQEEFQRFYTVLRQIIRQGKKSWSTFQSSLAYWLPMTPIRIPG